MSTDPNLLAAVRDVLQSGAPDQGRSLESFTQEQDFTLLSAAPNYRGGYVLLEPGFVTWIFQVQDERYQGVLVDVIAEITMSHWSIRQVVDGHLMAPEQLISTAAPLDAVAEAVADLMST